ncbi:MAG: hypothetical protein WBG86_02485 [Polyangiales bacterium]
MYFKPLIRLVLLSCAALIVGCGDAATEGSKGDLSAPRETTAVNLMISDPSSGVDELALIVDAVSYAITCPATGLVPFDDSLAIAGNFEIVAGADPPVWALVSDLPPSLCTISMWVFDEDEVVCTGRDSLPIMEDADPSSVNEFNLVLICSLSANLPTGDLEIEGDFQEVVGNTCPRLVWMNAVPTVFGPGLLPISAVQVYAFDPNDTCGNNCDPQSCDFSTNPPVCTPGPDPGLMTLFATTSGEGTFGDPGASNTTYTCDPAFPGATEVCVTAMDGDIECDRTRCITVVCP